MWFPIQSYLTVQMLQVAEYHDNSFVAVNPPKRPSIRERRQKLLTFLQGIGLLLCIFNIGHDGSFSCICSRDTLEAAVTDESTDCIPTSVVTEKYEPVHARWTTERCAVCRWVEDWDYNKIIICNRYCQFRLSCVWVASFIMVLQHKNWTYCRSTMTWDNHCKRPMSLLGYRGIAIS